MNGLNQEIKAFEECYEHLSQLQEMLYETQAQASSEASAFGDSWAGSHDQIQQLSSEVSELEDKLNNWFEGV